MGQKFGAPSNTVAWAAAYLRPSGILIHAAICPQQIWAENWGLSPFGGGELGLHLNPPNTVWPGPRPTCMPSFILMHPTVWPQYTNVTDRTAVR